MVKTRVNMIGWNMWEHGVPDSRLTVIERVDDYIKPNGKKEAQYKCLCNCGSGKEVVATSYSLKSGNTKSCGCISKELMSELGKRNKKYNIYDYTKDYGTGFCNNCNDKFYFDWDDFDKIKNYCWFKHISKDGYVSLRAHDLNSNKKQIKMYKLLTEYDMCDHKNRNPLDNRRKNLRQSTSQQNSRNHSVRKNNKSGVTGVYWAKDRNKWISSINIEKYKKNILGYFDDKNEAIIARLKAEKEYYKEFAPQRHLFKQYGIIQEGCD